MRPVELQGLHDAKREGTGWVEEEPTHRLLPYTSVSLSLPSVLSLGKGLFRVF